MAPMPAQAPTGLVTLFPLHHHQIIITMLFMLLVYSLTQGSVGSDGSPIPLVQPRADIPCNDLNNCRTRWSIIWSCLSTILLCTWVTLHPNISIAPHTHDKSWFKAKAWYPLRGFFKNKLLLFICGLLAPEYILAWAIRQHLRAQEILQKCITNQKTRIRTKL
jgi:hypothetical protein